MRGDKRERRESADPLPAQETAQVLLLLELVEVLWRGKLSAEEEGEGVEEEEEEEEDGQRRAS